MMAIDARRVQLDSRQTFDTTIDLSLQKYFCYNWFFFAEAFSSIVWRRVYRKQRKKSHDLPRSSLKTTECLQHFYCLLFFRGGEIIHRFPGYNSPRKLSKLFFLIIRFIIGRWLKSLYEKWKVLKVVWPKAPKKQKKKE